VTITLKLVLSFSQIVASAGYAQITGALFTVSVFASDASGPPHRLLTRAWYRYPVIAESTPNTCKVFVVVPI
jgi:hypothetical protein